jgi:hypothetical protein
VSPHSYRSKQLSLTSVRSDIPKFVRKSVIGYEQQPIKVLSFGAFYQLPIR